MWSIGTEVILKERSANPPNLEANNIKLLEEETPIPVPTVIKDWEENGRYFTKRIQGDTLEAAWPLLSAANKEHIAKQTAEYLLQLLQLHSPYM